jgi:hypothetical protein
MLPLLGIVRPKAINNQINNLKIPRINREALSLGCFDKFAQIPLACVFINPIKAL